MGALAEKLSAAIERLEGVREDVRDMREEMKDVRMEMKELHVEIVSLQNTRTHGKGWITGAGVVLSLVVSALGWVLRLSPLVLFLGCAELPVKCNTPARWAQEPTMAVDTSMPEACLGAVEFAQAFWAKNGKRLSVESFGPDWIGFHGIVPHGYIAVHHPDMPAAPDAAGSTWKERYAGSGDIRSADVEVTDCDNVLVAAHEIGHALGFGSCPEELGHHSDMKNLMFPVGPFGAEITQTQKDWIK